MARADIQARLGLDSTGFDRGIQRSKRTVSKFVGNAIKQFGALAGAAGLTMLARSAVDLGSKISDMAVQLNIGTTQLQVLDFAAREAGVGTEILARALRNVQLRTEEAIKGNKSYGDAFAQLGININEFKNLPVEQKLQAIAKAQASATDAGAAYNSVSRILGEKAGPALQEVLQNLAANGYGSLEAAAESAGEVMSEETIARMDAAADRIESFKRRMTVMTGEILTKVVPGFSIFANGLGVVGDGIGTLTSKFGSFLTFLGRNLGITISPAIDLFKSLSLGIEGVIKSLKRDFDGAGEAFSQSMDMAKESLQSLKDTSAEIGKNFKRLNEELAIDSRSMEQSMKTRFDNIGKAWKDMNGDMVKDSKKAKGEINAMGGDLTTGTGGGGTTTAKSGQSGGGTGLNIERGEFEGRRDFLLRRESARKGQILLDEERRKVAAGGPTPDAAKISGLKAQASGDPSSGSILKAAQETAESTKTIAKAVTGT